MYDVLVIGAGIIGAMTARELTKYNLSVCIAEKENDVAMGATKANSAIVHAGFDAKPNTLKAKFNVRGAEMMQGVAEELGVKYKNNGSLVIGFNHEDEKTIQALYEQGIQNGVKGLRVIGAEELRRLEPNITEAAVCALYAPTGSIVCPYELCIAAVGNAMDNGAVLKLNYTVSSVKRIEGGFEVSASEEQNENIQARYIVNAAGMYADDVAGLVGDHSFRIHPRRGEYILLDKDCGALTVQTIFRTPTKMGKGILVSPTVDGNLILGPTSVDMEREEKANTETTPEGFDRVICEAKENIKDIPFGKTITSFCGLRAVGSTGDFIINSPAEGFINAAGIESPGLSSSPAIAEYIAALLKSMGAGLEPNKSFQPIRKPAHAFRDADIKKKNEMISQNPRYGKIVCRCEGVTEGEIIDAIHQNPGARDIDGVKRRTRAGMGRCQGGFCLPYVTELLARELQLPYEEVTKRGGDSKVVIGRTKKSAKHTEAEEK